MNSNINWNLKDFQNQGYAIFKNYLNLNECNSFIDEALKCINQFGGKATAPIGDQKGIQNDQILNNIHYYSNKFLNIATVGPLIDFLIPVLNDQFYNLIPPDKPNFILAQCNLRKSESALQYHFDTRLKIPSKITWSIQGILAFGERNSLNGGLKIIPGSHLDPFVNREKLDISKEIDIELSAGDLVIFFSSLYHGTHSPTGKIEPSFGLLLTYRCWWCKPQFDFIRMFGLDRLKNYSDQQKTLLGYHSLPSSDQTASPSARSGYKVV